MISRDFIIRLLMGVSIMALFEILAETKSDLPKDWLKACTSSPP